MGPAEQVEKAVLHWRQRGWPTPRALVVSGSGLAVDLGTPLLAPQPLEKLLPFPFRSLAGHPHSFEMIEPTDGYPVLYLRGRLHAYQGYDGHQVTFIVRLARRLGASVLVMTNAAGGLHPDYRPGDLVMIRDHLNLTGTSPLLGTLPEEWGPQFPDMVNAYDPALRQLAHRISQELEMRLQEGVYAGVLGPAYETPAEVHMLRTLGADLGGMSTVQEVIAARHLSMRCLCFSLVTNLAAGVSPEPLNHEEVIAAGRQAAKNVSRFVQALLAETELYSVNG